MISITKIYDQLADKIGKETAENLTTFIEDKIEKGLDSRFTILESKIDNMANKFDNLKWAFIFWVGQAAVTFGFIMLYIKK